MSCWMIVAQPTIRERQSGVIERGIKPFDGLSANGAFNRSAI